MDNAPFDLDAVHAMRDRIDAWIVTTPTIDWQSDVIADRLGGASVSLKLELFQRTGTFKPRGALSVMLGLDRDQLARGVCAVSAGNHAIATAYAARCVGTSATVVMLPTANPLRIARCRDLGAEVEIAADGVSAFERAEELARVEGRSFVHPFEGPLTTLGTATLGVEWQMQAPHLDAIVIPVGGGGLCSGVGWAWRMLRPDCAIYGVEPAGANNMARSFAAGAPVRMEKVQTIADSLGPPYSLPYSFDLCRRVLDDIVEVSDDAMAEAVYLLSRDARLAVEPAAAAAAAALLGPLAERLAGRRVGVLVCGSNIDLAGFAAHAERGRQVAAASGDRLAA